MVEGGSDVVMWCTGHWVGAEPACPQWCGCSTHRESIYTALCSAHKGLGDGQRPSPSRQAHRPTPVSEGKGSGGRDLGGQGARVAGAPRREMQAGVNGGGDTLLTCVPSRRRSRNIPNLGLEVGVENRDLRQRGGDSIGDCGRNRIFTALLTQGAQCLHYWQPFPRSSSNFTRAVHAHQPPYATRACKRGVGPCARCRGRGAPGPSNRGPEADEVRSGGARSPSSAGTPFAVTGGHLALF